MDPRRPPRTVSDPKVRQVGFFAAPEPMSPSSDISPTGNSLSPVMIPPPRSSSDAAARPGDPDVILKVPGMDQINCLNDRVNCENLQALNLIYDALPSDYVSMIITDYGMVPPTSVPVIVREYRREQLWM